LFENRLLVSHTPPPPPPPPGEPKAIQRVGCQQQFVWETAAACPSAAFSLSDCKVEDPSSGASYDLAPLVRPEGYEVAGRDGNTYLLNLCAPLKVCDVTCVSPRWDG
jgi:hypothetical protein